MHTIVFLALLTALITPFKVRPFEALAWTVLTSPVWIYLALTVASPSVPLYWAIVLGNLIGWCLVRRNELPQNFWTMRSETGPLLALLAFSVLIAFLTSQWNEFFPMGERLRDYALLSSVIRSPFALTDPWLHGFGLNYYAFWYRTGNLLSVILQLPAPVIYNQLQVLTFGFFLAAIYRITTRFFGWSWYGGLFSAALIGFGSNLDGVFHVLKGASGWWGPSRVITGAINEFPVWSFLLGDLHPHFLNLATIPLLTILYLHLTAGKQGAQHLATKVLIGAGFLIIGALLIYNANAWEVPVWGLAIGGLLLGKLIGELKTSQDFTIFLNGFKKAFFNRAFLLSLPLVLALAASLWLSSRNILPNPFPVTLVKQPVPQTSFFEFFRHWGIPVLAMLVSLLCNKSHRLLAATVVISSFATLYSGSATPMLWGALLLTITTFYEKLRTQETSDALIVSGVINVVALILCLVPEYLFLDDPYGGENERMNTIFKMYSSNWFFFHLSALYMARDFFQQIALNKIVRAAAMISLLTFSSAFFLVTIKERKSQTRENAIKYASLASVADNFPGGADAVLFLRSQPGTVVLEAQGNAYDWTSYVSTLADKDSYLGWANHVNLLVREYGEISRREQITSRFYTSPTCEDRRSLLQQENIDFAVVGSLEFKKHPQSRNLDYSCLKKVFEDRDYRIFSR